MIVNLPRWFSSSWRHSMTYRCRMLSCLVSCKIWMTLKKRQSICIIDRWLAHYFQILMEMRNKMLSSDTSKSYKLWSKPKSGITLKMKIANPIMRVTLTSTIRCISKKPILRVKSATSCRARIWRSLINSTRRGMLRRNWRMGGSISEIWIARCHSLMNSNEIIRTLNNQSRTFTHL